MRAVGRGREGGRGRGGTDRVERNPRPRARARARERTREIVCVCSGRAKAVRREEVTAEGEGEGGRGGEGKALRQTRAARGRDEEGNAALLRQTLRGSNAARDSLARRGNLPLPRRWQHRTIRARRERHTQEGTVSVVYSSDSGRGGKGWEEGKRQGDEEGGGGEGAAANARARGRRVHPVQATRSRPA